MELGSENQNDYFVIHKNINETPLITRRVDGTVDLLLITYKSMDGTDNGLRIDMQEYRLP